MNSIAATLRKLETEGNIASVRGDIVNLILDCLSTRRMCFGDWERTHFSNAIGSLGLNIHGSQQPTVAWLRLCLNDLQKAVAPAHLRDPNFRSPDPSLKNVSCDQLMGAVEAIGRELGLEMRAARAATGDAISIKGRKRTDVFWAEMSACEHFVQIYEDEADFIERLQDFVHDGLDSGDATVVIATPAHRKALEARLAENGVDLARARREDRYIDLDAAATLALFMHNGWPDDARFNAAITDVLARARGEGRRIRAFGEMVALLWAEGHNAATLRLEHLWNELARRQPFSLFCAYPRVGFTENAAESIARVCALHSSMLAAPA